MNPGILNLDSINPYTKTNEAKLYDIQQNVGRATMAMARVAEKILEDENSNHVVDTRQVLKGCLDAVSLLGHASREISNRRKSNIKYSIVSL